MLKLNLKLICYGVLCGVLVVTVIRLVVVVVMFMYYMYENPWKATRR